MFNWFLEFLYGLVKALFQLSDAMIYGSKKLCGIDSIEVNGKETDLLEYLFRSDEVSSTFKIVAVSGIIVVMFFAVFAILRSITSRKQETTPVHVLIQTGKTLLMFLFVPAVMLSFMWICNEFINVINDSMTGSGSATLGSFLFTTCAEDAWYGEASDVFLNGTANYANVGDVSSYISLSNFNYMLGFLAGIAILFPIASMLIMFVDRAIAIVLLFIVSPYSISSNVLDDGAHFKLWRDQVLIKFVTGYGCIITLNIYALIIKLVINNAVVFFPTAGAQFLPIVSNSFLNSLMKVAIIVGGAFSLQKIMAVIGNLVSAGAGSNELRDTALVSGSMGRYLGGIGKLGGSAIASVLRAPRKLYGKAGNLAQTKKTSEESANAYTGTPSGASSVNAENDNSNKFSEQAKYNPGENAKNTNSVENIINNGGNGGGHTADTGNATLTNDKKDVVSNTILTGGNSTANNSRRTVGYNYDDAENEDLK